MRKNSSEQPAPAKPQAAQVWAWVTRLAFALAIVIVIVRSTMLEYLRDPVNIVPGEPPRPRGPGPTTTLALNLLAALPALLVAARAAFDCTFTLRKSRGNVVMLLLAVWTVIAAYRGDDRFAAIVAASNLLAAMALLWAAQQLVRDWRRVRLVAAVAFGLLLVYAAHGVIDRTVELPLRQQNWDRNAAQMLQSLNIEPGSYEADRLRTKIASGELLGFAASINTFAAVMVMLGVVAVGAVIQRRRDRDDPAIAAVIAIGLGGALLVVFWTDSRTALATPLLAAMLLGAIALFGRWASTHRRNVTPAIIACAFAGTLLLVWYGLKTGGLFHDSLDFRWRYWLGAYSVWLERPVIGVGFDDFQFHYLAHRMPIASEEVKDPHNFIVRAFSEMGVIGGALVLMWVGRGMWEMSLPARLPAEAGRPPIEESNGMSDLAKIVCVCAGGVLLSWIIVTDWERLDWNATMDALKRLLYACVLTIGAAVVALRSFKQQWIDDRSASWIRRAMTVGVVIFLVHNLVDFAMFESSAMFIAALIAGTTWGIGLTERVNEKKPLAVARFAGGTLAWLAAAVVWAVPTIFAESAAGEADELLRQNRFRAAADLYLAAWRTWPSNADYAHRASRALAMMPGSDPARIKDMLDAAVLANPMNSKHYLMRAQFESQKSSPDPAAVGADYERALKLDPNAVARRLEYADALARLGQLAAAREQYELALSFNDKLHPDEPKRLSPEKLTAVKETIARLAN